MFPSTMVVVRVTKTIIRLKARVIITVRNPESAKVSTFQFMLGVYVLCWFSEEQRVFKFSSVKKDIILLIVNGFLFLF